MYVETSCALVLVVFMAMQTYGHDRINIPVKLPVNGSLGDTIKQIQDLKNTVNTLVENNTIGNTLTSLKIAKQRLIQARDNANQKNVIQWLNETVSNIFNYVMSIQKSASAQGVDASNCTQTMPQDLWDLTYNYTENLTNCPIDEADKGLAMINRDIQYVSYLGNLTTSFPIVLNNCASQKNPMKCYVTVLGAYGITIAGAPAKLTGMAAEISTYFSFLQTNLGLCTSGVTLGTLAKTTELAVNKTTCIAGFVPQNSTN